ncbi:MAG: trypsin-like peptidase domain-containing protein [Defluviitaleaceae bacterium]|nr:trypsin-like peptidase domain-containing protein [Defluviitaleaceae bacterium]
MQNYNNENTSLQLKTPNFIIVEEAEAIKHEDTQPSPPPYINFKRKRGKSFGTKISMVMAFVLLGSFGMGLGIGTGYSVINRLNPTAEPVSHFPQEMLLAATAPYNIGSSMVSAVDRVLPSVVSIETTTIRQTGGPGFSSQFFIEREVPASGTGIIFYLDDTNIYIVTNEHVISEADSINIYFGRSRNNGVEAFVKGRYVPSDLAVLYIPRDSLSSAQINNIVVAEFGNSSEMRIGEFVMAIGNALGQGISTTIGVVSATDIEIQIDNRSIRAMQTDAAINPGNSGGPLINSAGQVIGINTVKISRPNVYGMGYSILSNIAIPIIDSIMNETARPILGITGNDLYNLSEYARNNITLEYEIDDGVFVIRVQRNSGAERGGLQPYDVITHFNGRVVINMNMLRDFLSEQSLGDRITLGIVRNGETMTLDVELRQF